MHGVACARVASRVGACGCACIDLHTTHTAPQGPDPIGGVVRVCCSRVLKKLTALAWLHLGAQLLHMTSSQRYVSVTYGVHALTHTLCPHCPQSLYLTLGSRSIAAYTAYTWSAF